MSENNRQWLGTAIITVFLSIIGATATTSGRIATMETRIKNSEQRTIELNKIYMKKLDKIEEKQDITNTKLIELNNSIIELNGKLNLKQDKKWKE